MMIKKDDYVITATMPGQIGLVIELVPYDDKLPGHFTFSGTLATVKWLDSGAVTALDVAHFEKIDLGTAGQ